MLADEIHQPARIGERVIAQRHHRALGPGLLKVVYAQCLGWELQNAGLAVERDARLTLCYEGLRFDTAFHADMIVEDSVLLDIKSVEQILQVHEAQTRTSLKLSGCRLGLLMNFNSPMLKTGLRRYIN